MRQHLLAVVAFLLLSGVAQAQIFAVHFSDEKHVKKYKANVTYIGGVPVIVGESYENLEWDPVKGQTSFMPTNRVKLFVSDPGDPTRVPYKYDRDGERVPRKSKYVVDIDPSHISNVAVLIRDDTLEGLAVEYLYRLDRIEELMDERDDLDKGTEPYFLVQQRVVAALEKLQSWLRNTAFPEAAEDLDRDIKKEQKVVAKAGVDARAQRAFESVTKEMSARDVPSSLVQATKELTDDRIQFKMRESQHLRITFVDSINESMIENAMLVGEKVIEFYRNEFVDPYRRPDFEDRIPDGIFHEFWFGPDDLALHEQFLVKHYGGSWGEEHKERRLATAMTGVRGYRGLVELTYSKSLGGQNLEGTVCHRLGHSLAALHFAGGQPAPDWLEEASAYYCSLDFLGRNSVTCLDFAEARYLKPAGGDEGEKTLQLSFRDWLNQLALERGPRIDLLAIKTLAAMEDPDLAKSWSFFDYVARREGIEGQRWLRAHCEARAEGKGMVSKWRELSSGIYETPGVDVFKVLDDRWRDFARSGQDRSKGKR